MTTVIYAGECVGGVLCRIDYLSAAKGLVATPPTRGRAGSGIDGAPIKDGGLSSDDGGRSGVE